jgi:hypothetical protein
LWEDPYSETTSILAKSLVLREQGGPCPVAWTTQSGRISYEPDLAGLFERSAPEPLLGDLPAPAVIAIAIALVEELKECENSRDGQFPVLDRDAIDLHAVPFTQAGGFSRARIAKRKVADPVTFCAAAMRMALLALMAAWARAQ